MRDLAVTARTPGLVARLFGALRLPLNDPFAVCGLLIYAIFLVTAIFADQIAPYDPTEILYTPEYDLAADLRPGEEGHLLGTTSLGRDTFPRSSTARARPC